MKIINVLVILSIILIIVSMCLFVIHLLVDNDTSIYDDDREDMYYDALTDYISSKLEEEAENNSKYT